MIEIIRLYKSGQSIREIAEKLGVSKTTIHKKLRREIDLRPPVYRKHKIDITEIINYNTETCAYWLGYLAYKGYFHQTRITLILSSRHYRHLTKWLKSLRSSLTPIKRDNLCKVSINHAELSQFYEENGVLALRKNDPFRIPIEQIIKRHFLRGIWDSSGIITNSSRYLRIGLSSKNEDILRWIVNLFELDIAINHVDKHNDKYYAWWCGTPATTIARYLYLNQTISLDNKTKKVLPYLI